MEIGLNRLIILLAIQIVILSRDIFAFSFVPQTHQGIKIALTREKDQNYKLKELINSKHKIVEMPCIQFKELLPNNWLERYMDKFDVIAITSPEAARIFTESWKHIGKPSLKVVSVGKGSSNELEKEGITVSFSPFPIFDGVSLGQQLPPDLGSRVLYPCSKLANSKFIQILEDRGFKVKRVDTYTTLETEFTPEEISIGKSCDIVALASPSAVVTWVKYFGSSSIAVVIGRTSEDAAHEHGFRRVFCPKEGSSGIESWAQLINDVADSVNR